MQMPPHAHLSPLRKLHCLAIPPRQSEPTTLAHMLHHTTVYAHCSQINSAVGSKVGSPSSLLLHSWSSSVRLRQGTTEGTTGEVLFEPTLFERSREPRGERGEPRGCETAETSAGCCCDRACERADSSSSSQSPVALLTTPRISVSLDDCDVAQTSKREPALLPIVADDLELLALLSVPPRGEAIHLHLRLNRCSVALVAAIRALDAHAEDNRDDGGYEEAAATSNVEDQHGALHCTITAVDRLTGRYIAQGDLAGRRRGGRREDDLGRRDGLYRHLQEGPELSRRPRLESRRECVVPPPATPGSSR